MGSLSMPTWPQTISSAIRECYESYYETLYRLAYRLSGSHDMAEKLCVGGFQQIITHFSQNPETPPPEPHYLAKMARRWMIAHVSTTSPRRSKASQTPGTECA